VPGVRITEQLVADMPADLAEKILNLDPSKMAIVTQLLDNSCYECKTKDRDSILPDSILPLCARDEQYQSGELCVIGKDSLREHFLTLQPVFKTVKGYKVIMLTRLPRYLWNRCCSDLTHIHSELRV
jgi:hypothetical protein